jgi:hypothetical protein
MGGHDGAVVVAEDLIRIRRGDTAVAALRGVSVEIPAGRLTASETPRSASTADSPSPKRRVSDEAATAGAPSRLAALGRQAGC